MGMLFRHTAMDVSCSAVLSGNAQIDSGQIARYLQARSLGILPSQNVYREGAIISMPLRAGGGDAQGVERFSAVVASSGGVRALSCAFLTQTKLPVEHAFFDGGQFAQIGKVHAPHHDTVSVFRYQEPVLVEGRHAEKDSVV